MTATSDSGLTRALEEYLFVIGGLTDRHKVARVKDIARERGVKPGSVSPAMGRLQKLGLIRYRQREFIELTPRGAAIARRVAERRGILARFLVDVLGMDPSIAGRDAKALEHALSEEACHRLVRLVESADADAPAAQRRVAPRRQRGRVALTELPEGASGSVAAIDASAVLRNRLLDLGIVPD
ncbi:MAG TPA: metal-dependent transcriptional regulator, partial [Polyangia bacterium]|nr:metal-dependent transcriptional regulator [Polyangia bacterium]